MDSLLNLRFNTDVRIRVCRAKSQTIESEFRPRGDVRIRVCQNNRVVHVKVGLVSNSSESSHFQDKPNPSPSSNERTQKIDKLRVQE